MYFSHPLAAGMKLLFTLEHNPLAAGIEILECSSHPLTLFFTLKAIHWQPA